MHKELCLLNGTSGRENEVRDYIIRRLPSDCSYSVDGLGNVIAEKKGSRRPKNKIMLSAHMDEVGFIITYITDEGFLKFAPVGGIDERVVFGRSVTVGERKISGVIASKAVHHLTAEEMNRAPGFDEMYIDIGADGKKQAEHYVSVGDSAYFNSQYIEYGEGFVKAKALDDRMGCDILLDILSSYSEYDYTACFVTQEEIGTRGATVAAYNVEPDYAVVIEGTTANDISGTPDGKKVCSLGGGAVISYMDAGTVYDFELYKRAVKTAEDSGIKWQTKTAVAGGNDAAAIHKSRSGVKTVAVSVPTRYIHSPSCVAKLEDIQSVKQLAVKLIEELADD